MSVIDCAINFGNEVKCVYAVGSVIILAVVGRAVVGRNFCV